MEKPMSGPAKVRHISSMTVVERAQFSQHVQEALLAIVATQKKPVIIPKPQLDKYSASHALVIEFKKGEDGIEYMQLTAQAAPQQVKTKLAGKGGKLRP